MMCGLAQHKTKTVICIVVFQSLLVLRGATEQEDEQRQLFSDFNKKYNKNYKIGSEEYKYRFTAFQETLKRISKLNLNQSHRSLAFYGITQYADLTPKEFHNKFLNRNHLIHNKTEINADHRKKRALNNSIVVPITAPSNFDWRDRKVVSAVKNQGDCGACWAFSNVETMETMYAIKTGQLPELSVQQLIDCALNGNYGCQGGDTCLALAWLTSTKVHVVTEKEYPFIRMTGQCKVKDPPQGVQLQTYECTDYRNNENAMVNLIASHGPLVVAVDATMWQDYLGGIIKYHCETVHNHAVQIVGYDLTGPVPYYIVRNSWGPDFGLSGYLHIAIGKDLCGIAREVSTLDVV